MTKFESALKVRHIDFTFDQDIPFQWNPGNPQWGNLVNYITMIAPAFERYFIKATRKAIPLMTSEQAAIDADLFCKQEAQHSKHHLAHLKVLTQHYPGLDETHRQVMQSYENLYENNSIDFHLAYAAIVELYLGPLANFVVEHRNFLFSDTDPRIASFILWHFIEEFEHRNSAIDVFNEVVGSYWYRLRNAPKVIAHIAEVHGIVARGFKEHVPVAADGSCPSATSKAYNAVPMHKTIKLLYDWVCTLLPYHVPDNIKEPEWVKRWHRDEQAGVDMTRYYPEVSR